MIWFFSSAICPIQSFPRFLQVLFKKGITEENQCFGCFTSQQIKFILNRLSQDQHSSHLSKDMISGLKTFQKLSSSKSSNSQLEDKVKTCCRELEMLDLSLGFPSLHKVIWSYYFSRNVWVFLVCKLNTNARLNLEGSITLYLCFTFELKHNN